MKRAYNFNAGPSAMPLEVLLEAQEEFLNYQNTGMSIIEMSHRSNEYAALHAETKQLLRDGNPRGLRDYVYPRRRQHPVFNDSCQFPH
mgnify:CR=1 FL=1